jgi:Predicted membrane protein
MLKLQPRLERFLFSHHLFGGLRQAVGVMLPPLVIGGLFGLHQQGMTAAVGAACVAFLDQPGGPRRYGMQGMAAAVLLGSLTVAIVGLSCANPVWLWLTVPLLTFVFSMLTVFGKQGGILGFACLLIMALTMRSRPDFAQLWIHTTYSLGGGLFYFLYSSVVHRMSWHREEQQALSAALFATADYMRARSALYDTEAELETHYRRLVRAQHQMTEEQQAARDTVLRELPKGEGRNDRSRAAALNLFIDMVALLDSLVATHTDYRTLRRHFGEGDVLLFPRDALRKLAQNVDLIALNVARNRRQRLPHTIKPELRALEFELHEMRQRNFDRESPEVYALMVKVLQRLRRANELVVRMAENTRRGTSTALVDRLLDHALDRFLTRRKWRLGMLTSNLRLDSPHFRYAVRVTIAVTIGMTVATLLGNVVQDRLGIDWEFHDYWVLLTVLVIMKPGYALTRQRNGWRLTGTLIGCGLSLLIFNTVENTFTLSALLFLSGVLWYALLQLNFMLAAAANTVFVLLAFHFLSPHQHFALGERVADTVLASAIALLCSHFVLPWWESNYMGSLAAALRRANSRFLNSGLDFAAASRQLRALKREQEPDSPEIVAGEKALQDAELHWRVNRKNMHIAFSNFTGAFYRMMDEPIKRQQHVRALNALMTQHHTLASHVSAVIPLLAEMDEVPDDILALIGDIEARLGGDETPTPIQESDTHQEDRAELSFPLRQMQRAAMLIEELTPLVMGREGAESDKAAAIATAAVRS